MLRDVAVKLSGLVDVWEQGSGETPPEMVLVWVKICMILSQPSWMFGDVGFTAWEGSGILGSEIFHLGTQNWPI